MTDETLRDDLRVGRARLAALVDDIDRVDPDHAEGSAALVVVTFAETAYPTSALASFACRIQEVGGVEAEGAIVTLSDTGAVLYAQNRGNAIPPPGTPLIVVQAGDRWVFQYG